MGLTNKKEEQLRNMPLIESKVLRSKDGKYMIHRLIMTEIKPIGYYKKVMEAPTEEQVEEVVEDVPKAEA